MPKITIHNVETGELVEREMTEEEILQWENDQAKAAQQIQKEHEAATKRQALLDKLGITEEEAKLLLS